MTTLRLEFYNVIITFLGIFGWTSGQKLINYGKNETCGQTVLSGRSLFIGQKMVENAKIEKNQMRHLG